MRGIDLLRIIESPTRYYQFASNLSLVNLRTREFPRCANSLWNVVRTPYENNVNEG